MKLFKLIILAFYIFIIPLTAQESKEQTNAGDAQHSQTQATEQEKNQSKAPDVKTEYGTVTVVVKGRRSRVKEIDKASTSTEVTAKDIEERSDKLLKDVLHLVPGMQVITERKGTTKFKLRGYDMSQVAILIDGIPIIDSYGGGTDIDNIGLMDTTEIIITRGTCSALYGARGTVGSINFIKREPTEMYTDVSAEYGEHINYVISVSHGAPIGDFFYYISGLYDKLRGYTVSDKLDIEKRKEWLWKLSRYDLYGETEADILSKTNMSTADDYVFDKGLWDHTNHEKYKLNGKAGYHITPDLEAGISSFYNYSKMENSVYESDFKNRYAFNDGTGEMDWSEPDKNKILGNMSSRWPELYDYAVAPYINYEHNKLKIKGNVYFYEQSSTFAAYADPQETTLAYNREDPTMTWSIWTSQTYGFNIYPAYKFASWNTLNFALTYYISNHREEEKAYNEESTDVLKYYGYSKYEKLYIEAGYLTLAIEDEMKIRENIDFTIGVSYDAQNLTKYQKAYRSLGYEVMVDQEILKDTSTVWGTRDSFNPVAGIVYEPLKDLLKLRAAASRKISFPTLQAYANIHNYYDEIPEGGDIPIKPEKSINANTGFELSLLNKQLTWRNDYFYSRYDDKIIRVYIMRLDNYMYRNVDSVITHGAESILTSDFNDVLNIADIDISVTYTYLYARNRTDVKNSFINKGGKVEKLPEHKFTFDFRTHFNTGTSLIIFGYLEYNQMVYTMGSRPQDTDEFSTSYFYEQKIHNPLMMDVKLSQTIYYDYEVYVMCRNILDDYNADPFNPGPGRMWYIGGKAEF